MSYSEKRLCRTTFPNFDFGGTSGAQEISFRLPNDEHGLPMQGQVVKIGVMITEATVWTTNKGTFELGTAADPDAFCKLEIPTSSAAKDCIDETDDTDAIIAKNIPANTLVEATFTEGTGAGLAGQGIPFVDILCWR
jgi:hypothetical protein